LNITNSSVFTDIKEDIAYATNFRKDMRNLFIQLHVLHRTYESQKKNRNIVQLRTPTKDIANNTDNEDVANAVVNNGESLDLQAQIDKNIDNDGVANAGDSLDLQVGIDSVKSKEDSQGTKTDALTTKQKSSTTNESDSDLGSDYDYDSPSSGSDSDDTSSVRIKRIERRKKKKIKSALRINKNGDDGILLRLGDTIEYQKPGVYGPFDPRGRDSSTILSTNPDHEYPLRLENNDCVGPSFRVRIVSHLNGEYNEYDGGWQALAEYRIILMNSENGNTEPTTIASSILNHANTLRRAKNKLDEKGVEFLRGDHDRVHGDEQNSLNYYEVLGIDATADQTAIKTAYRELALLHHPDKGGIGNRFKEINAGEFIEIVQQ
jgi:hypothetical protein